MLDLATGEQSEYYGTFSTAQARAFSVFGRLLQSWRKEAEDLKPLALMDKILNDIDYQSFLDDGTEEGIERWENVMELRRLAAEYDQRPLIEFLEEVALVSDQDTVDSNANVPTLLTLHAAKGLEYPVVFISGLEDGTLPHIRSFDEPESMDEERRLLYVGITRAKDRLYLTHALNRSTYGFTEPTDPSRFLEDIPDELTEGSAPAGIRISTRQRKFKEQTTWGSNDASAPIIEPTFRAGQNVRHPTYGEGMVLNTKIDDGDEIVDVFFGDMGTNKRLLASFAKLEIIE